MKINIIRQIELSDLMLRYWVQLPAQGFTLFGYLIESADGMGYHRHSQEYDNTMEVDVSKPFKRDFEQIVEYFRNMPDDNSA
jgi:hypothetical protein